MSQEEIGPDADRFPLGQLEKRFNRLIGLGSVKQQALASQKHQALLVPDQVLGTDQAGNYLLVVGKDDVVEERQVVTGQLFGALREITQGLSADDRVVVSGLQRAIAGQKVAPAETKIDASPQPAP